VVHLRTLSPDELAAARAREERYFGRLLDDRPAPAPAFKHATAPPPAPAGVTLDTDAQTLTEWSRTLGHVRQNLDLIAAGVPRAKHSAVVLQEALEEYATEPELRRRFDQVAYMRSRLHAAGVLALAAPLPPPGPGPPPGGGFGGSTDPQLNPGDGAGGQRGGRAGLTAEETQEIAEAIAQSLARLAEHYQSTARLLVEAGILDDVNATVRRGEPNRPPAF